MIKMNEEVKELLDKLGNMEDAPLIWINRKVENLLEENKQLKENNMSMQKEMVRTWEKLDDLQQIEQEHQKINGELREENKKYKEVIDKAINNSQYWIDYYTRLNSDERIALRLQENIDILKEVE